MASASSSGLPHPQKALLRGCTYPTPARPTMSLPEVTGEVAAAHIWSRQETLGTPVETFPDWLSRWKPESTADAPMAGGLAPAGTQYASPDMGSTQCGCRSQDDPRLRGALGSSTISPGTGQPIAASAGRAPPGDFALA